jgi:NAD(P)-dependent dehydrogenase (short-subunit alcohol dehydrogenase family)
VSTTADLGIGRRTIVLTGASRGIGAALARSFAQAGAQLGLLARNEAALEELAARLPSAAVLVACDVRDADAVADGFDQVTERFGGVDSVVVNAGISPATHRAHNLSLAVWREVIDVNLTGAFTTAHAAHRHLAASGHGRLVLTSSVMARLPRRGLSAYVASKGAIEGLTRALAIDWAPDGICVNAVAPGFFDTGLGTAFAESGRLREQVMSRTPLGRFGNAPELTLATAFLAGDASSYLTGQVLAVDGGYGLG